MPMLLLLLLLLLLLFMLIAKHNKFTTTAMKLPTTAHAHSMSNIRDCSWSCFVNDHDDTTSIFK
jgi:hypothetical protein